jgi:CheY-like chemotaxis protein
MPILIVDDVESNLAVLGALLRRSALNDLRTHTRPSDALDDVRANDLDLIVVDYAMPEMNGVEFIEHVRQIPRHTDTRSSWSRRTTIGPFAWQRSPQARRTTSRNLSTLRS